MKTTGELLEAVLQFRNGENEAFTQIYTQSYQYLYTCMIHIMKNEDAAMDMLQETYMEISKSITQLQNPEDFLSWAATIGNRKCFAYLKKNDKHIFMNDGSNEDDENNFFDKIADDEAFIPENILQDEEKQRLIKEIIDNLSDMQRLCVIGFYYNEEKQEQIAENLGIPVSTVKSHLNRAKAKIKEAIVELDEEKGTRLYTVAPFLLLFFTKEAKACEIKPMNESVSKSMESGQSAVNGTTKSITKMSLSMKVGIGVASTAILIGGIVAYRMMNAQNNAAVQTETAMVDHLQTDTKNVQKKDTDEGIENSAAIDDTNDTEEENSVSEIMTLAGYDSVGYAYGDVVPVQKNGLWGAINYAQEEIIPCEYDSFIAPNKKGYFVLSKTSESTEASDAFGIQLTNQLTTYTLFAPDGTILYEGTNKVQTSGNFYAIIEYGEEDSDFAGKVNYYNYDGKFICTTEVDDKESSVVINGDYDRGATLYQVIYKVDSEMIENIGTLDENENVSWNSRPIYEGAISWENENITDYATDNISSTVVGNGTSTNFTDHIPMQPISSLNHGYVILQNVNVEAGYMKMLDDQNNEVCRWNISKMTPSEDGFTIGNDSYYNEGNWYKGFFYDGFNVYNYGSKMVWTIGDNEVLVDISLAPDMDYEHMTTDIIQAVCDSIYMSDEKYWLVEKNGQWGYIDHDGIEVAMYDDASEFYHGKSLIIESGIAYLINDNFEKIQEFGEADSVMQDGELYIIKKGDNLICYQ